jgi:hypothetical protein
MASSGFSISSIRPLPTRASQRFKGSTFGEGIDWIILNNVSFSAQSVSRNFPSGDSIFNRTILSYASTYPSEISFFLRSLQYFRGRPPPTKTSITSMMENYQLPIYRHQRIHDSISLRGHVSLPAGGIAFTG